MTTLRIPPKLDPAIEQFIDTEKQLLRDLVSAFGSPLNIIFPDHAVKNADTFYRLLATQPLKSRIFFAQKVNKSLALSKALAKTSVGTDIASSGELFHALTAGFAASRIEATGPKNRTFLCNALCHGITINCDSLEEIRQIIELAPHHAVRFPVSIFLRLASISEIQNTLIHESRFGIAPCKINEALEMLVAHRTHINFLGFSYHLNAASEEEKIRMLEEVLQKTSEAKKLGLAPQFINIGGGFSIRRSGDRASWLSAVSLIKQSVLGTVPPLTWNNSGYGFRSEQGVLRGAAGFMQEPTYDPSEALLKFLETPLPSFGHLPAASVIGEQLLTLVIEPGQALLDQAGITIAEVLGTKISARGETVVILDMNRSNINATDIETFTDPLLLPQKNTPTEEPVGVYFAGNLCLHGDILIKHRVTLSQMPTRGDLVLFANTAPYAMDFAESETIRQPVAQKIAMAWRGNRWRWWTDEHYNPHLV